MENTKVDIAFCSWNRPQFTRWSLQSIYENTKYPHRVIVIDNGSEPAMQMQLAEMKYKGWIDQLILLDKNYGLETAKHLVMEFVDSSPYFISTDNDILAYKYEPDWLERLVGLMDKYPEYGCIGCRPQILVGSGNPFAGKEDQDIIDFPHIPGYLRIMRTEFVRAVGAWKDKRPLRGHEEIWISEKFREVGWKIGWANNVKCWHLFGEENWGYGNDMTPEAHGHSEISSLPKDDKIAIKEGTGITVNY